MSGYEWVTTVRTVPASTSSTQFSVNCPGSKIPVTGSWDLRSFIPTGEADLVASLPQTMGSPQGWTFHVVNRSAQQDIAGFSVLCMNPS